MPQGAANGQDSRDFFKDTQGFVGRLDAGSRAGFTSSRPPPPPRNSLGISIFYFFCKMFCVALRNLDLLIKTVGSLEKLGLVDQNGWSVICSRCCCLERYSWVCCCCCCFSHPAYWLPTRKHYTVANPARGLLNREKRLKEEVWRHTPPPPTPHTARSEKKSRYASTGATQVLVGLASVQGYLQLVD